MENLLMELLIKEMPTNNLTYEEVHITRISIKGVKTHTELHYMKHLLKEISTKGLPTKDLFQETLHLK